MKYFKSENEEQVVTDFLEVKHGNTEYVVFTLFSSGYSVSSKYEDGPKGLVRFDRPEFIVQAIELLNECGERRVA